MVKGRNRSDLPDPPFQRTAALPLNPRGLADRYAKEAFA